MTRVASDPQAVLNEFLRCYLADREAGEERSLAEYRALFPGHGELIERELAALRGEAREEAPSAGEAARGRARRPEDAAGKRFGPYVLVRPLGQGGQGLVWLARDTRLERPVALKLLTQLAALSAQALERFYREAQISSRLDDPGICAIYETGSEHGVHYIAMRYVEGESLATLLDRARAQEQGPRLPALPSDPDESSADVVAGAPGGQQLVPRNPAPPRDSAEAVERAVRLFELLARSLHRAHEAGVVHRDIKPGNVMVGKNGKPVLLDFGLAGVLDESLPSFTRTGDVFGTPAYMAPEQIAPETASGEERADRRSDVYALGATLYECLTLRHPFESVSREALYQAIRQQDPADPRRTNPAIAADLWTILQTCLAKERGRRYQSALELAEDLRRFREGKPVRAHPPSRIYKARRFVQRYRALVTATLLVMLALSTATVVATTGLFRARVAEEKATRAALSENRLRLEAQGSAAEAIEQKKRAEEQRLATRRSSYAAQMELAFTAWEKRNWNRVLELLRTQVPKAGEEDLRGFEWYSLWKLCHPGLLGNFRDPESTKIVALGVASDGESCFTLGDGGRVARWRIADGALLDSAELGCLPERLGASFSRDSRVLAAFDGDLEAPAIEVWETKGWRRVMRLVPSTHEVSAVTLSRDGRLLGWVEGGTRAIVTDMERGQRILDRESGLWIGGMAFSPEGGTLAIAGGDKVNPRAIALLLDLGHGEQARFDCPGPALDVDFAPDGRHLALSGNEWVVRILDVPSAREIGRLEGHQGGIPCVAFSPDGSTLASVGGSDSTLRFWSVEEGMECSPLRAQSAVASGGLYFTPAGDRLLVLGKDSSVNVWSVAVDRAPITVAAPLDVPHDYYQLSLLAFSPDSRTLALNEESGALALLDVESRTIRATLERGEHVTCAAYAPDGWTLALGTKAGELALWSANGARAIARVRAHENEVRDLAFSPDGASLVSGGEDGKVALWNARTLASEGSHSRHAQRVYCVLFDTEGASIWSSSADGTVKRWDPGQGEDLESYASVSYELVSLPRGGGIGVVTGDWTPTLRDTPAGFVRTTFGGHAGGSYRAIAFAHDGRTLATGSVDKTVKLWQVATGQEVCTLPMGNHVHSVAFSPDGRWLAAWSCDGVVQLWPAATPEEVARMTDEVPEVWPVTPSSGSLALEPAWSATGDQANAWFGMPVAAAGDVDGDGFGDILVGAQRCNRDAGGAFLFRGSAQGPSPAPVWAASGEAGAQLGKSLAGAGDVDRDGYDDVVVGAGWFDGVGPDAGQAALYLGSPTGLAQTPAWTVEGDQALAHLGQAVAGAGDVNGDGYDDVLVGASGDDGDAKESGRVFLYLGSNHGLGSRPDWSARASQAGAQLGYSLSTAGDVNGDGYADVVVAAHRFDGEYEDEGRVALYLGSAAGLAPDPVWTSTGGQASCIFGYSVSAAGDVNGDGLGDFLVGATYFDHRRHDEGKVFLYLGSPGGVPRASDWSPEGRRTAAYLGAWVSAAGDVDGDGFDDVLVGANGFDTIISNEGCATLYLGSSTGLSRTPAWTARGTQANAELGQSLSATGDVNGDGLADVLLGEYRRDGAYPDEGRALLYLGRPRNGPPASSR